jgi:Fur family ferric uptake transcriptional regulator
MRPNRPQRRPLVQELASRKIRVTSQRRILMETMQEADGHLDAATLLTLARERDPQIDRATVYRTLDMLKKLRLVDELDLMHLHGEKHYYEAKGRKEHVHLACIECGSIEEFSSASFERLKEEIARKCGFDIRVTRFEVGGRCSKCRRAIENKRTTHTPSHHEKQRSPR